MGKNTGEEIVPYKKKTEECVNTKMEKGWVMNDHRGRNPGRRGKNMERRKFEGKQHNGLKQ